MRYTSLPRLLLLLCCTSSVAAWTPRPPVRHRSAAPRTAFTATSQRPRPQSLPRGMTASVLEPSPQEPGAATAASSSSDADEAYEVIEYDYLSEEDFLGSEWCVGTLYTGDTKIQETWVRLARNADGKNVCYWGTKDEGTWSLDVASQFLSVSREKFYGKEIWACTVDDYYYLQGTVRGWKLWSTANVYGQWQAIRLGVDAEEAGKAPWFKDDKQEKEN